MHIQDRIGLKKFAGYEMSW